MSRFVAAAVLLFAFASIASADVIYQYTGAPFDQFGTWNDLFGPNPPTRITATIDVANPFPDTGAGFNPFGGCGFVGSPLPGLLQGHLTGIISGTISDGTRTVTDNFLEDFDEITLSGCGTQITQWYMGAIFSGPTSDSRAIISAHIVDPLNSDGGGTPGYFDSTSFPTQFDIFTGIVTEGYDAETNVAGQWTSTITPEINTGALALISGSLLLVGYWRKPRKN